MLMFSISLLVVQIFDGMCVRPQCDIRKHRRSMGGFPLPVYILVPFHQKSFYAFHFVWFILLLFFLWELL